MATPTADSYTAAPGQVVHAGRGAPVPVPPSVAAPGAYRTTQQWLFADALADTVIADEDVDGSLLRTTPPRAGIAAPSEGYLWSALGPHRDYVDLRGGWPWANAGGDWINTAGTPQATASPHFTFAANAVASGSAAYTVDVTAGAQAAQAGSRWHAYIVRCTGGGRALVSQHHDTLPAASVAVTYSDGTTGTLQCVACVSMPSGTSYTQVGRPEQPIGTAINAALEFERPTKAVTSATMTVRLAQHTSTAATVSGYLANPPVTTATVVQGIAATYPADVGLAGNGAVLVSHRFQDGSTLADWVVPTAINVFNRALWDQELLGLGAESSPSTKLPAAYAGTPLAGKWFHKQADFIGNVSLVSSAHTGDNFQPLASGLGALRVVVPKSSAADGATVPSVGSTGSDLWLLFPKSVSGTDTLKRTFVRFYFRYTGSAKRLANTKMFRNAGLAAKYATHTGKWGVGVHHWTSRGGNNRTGGDGLGWSNRLVLEQIPTDMPVAGLLNGLHSLDMFNGATTAPAGNVGGNLPFGKSGGRGASVYPDRWYCMEVECDLNTWDAGGASPYDGVQRAWLDGVLVAEWTGVRYRNGPLSPAGTGTDLPPFRQLGPIGLALNEYMGGILPADEDRVCFYSGIVCGTSYIGPMAAAEGGVTVPTLAPGSVDQIGYSSGAHPLGMDASMGDLNPLGKSWNPTPANEGPWSIGKAGNIHPYSTTAGAYGGAAFAADSREYIQFGDGHVAQNMPVLRLMRLPTLSWHLSSLPVPSDGFNLSSGVSEPASVAALEAAYPPEQLDTTWGCWLGDWSGWPAGFSRPGKLFPVPSHSRYGLVWVPGSAAGNTKGILLLVMGCSGALSGTAIQQSGMYCDLDTGDWHRTANRRSMVNGAAGGGVWFGGSVNVVFGITHVSSISTAAVDVFNPATKTWTPRTATNSIDLPVDGCGFVAHEESGLLMAMIPVTSGGAAAYNGTQLRVSATSAAQAKLGAHTWSTLTLSNPGGTWPVKADGNLGRIGWARCPRNGCMYAINGQDNSATLWKLSPPAGAADMAGYLAGTWTITTETLSAPIRSRGGAGASNSSNVYNRLQWDEAGGTFVYQEEYHLAKLQRIRPIGV